MKLQRVAMVDYVKLVAEVMLVNEILEEDEVKLLEEEMVMVKEMKLAKLMILLSAWARMMMMIYETGLKNVMVDNQFSGKKRTQYFSSFHTAFHLVP
jgi:hypothetical protein